MSWEKSVWVWLGMFRPGRGHFSGSTFRRIFMSITSTSLLSFNAWQERWVGQVVCAITETLLVVFNQEGQCVKEMCLLPGWGWCQWWGPAPCGNWRWVRWAGSPPDPSSSAGRSRAPGCPGWSNTRYRGAEKWRNVWSALPSVHWHVSCCCFLLSFPHVKHRRD